MSSDREVGGTVASVGSSASSAGSACKDNRLSSGTDCLTAGKERTEEGELRRDDVREVVCPEEADGKICVKS